MKSKKGLARLGGVNPQPPAHIPAPLFSSGSGPSQPKLPSILIWKGNVSHTVGSPIMAVGHTSLSYHLLPVSLTVEWQVVIPTPPLRVGLKGGLCRPSDASSLPHLTRRAGLPTEQRMALPTGTFPSPGSSARRRFWFLPVP